MASRMTLVFFPGIFDELTQIFRVQEKLDPLFPNAQLLQSIPYKDRTFSSLLNTVNHWIRKMLYVWLELPHTDIGQDVDVARLSADGVADIAFGISRGAATTLTRWAHATTHEAVPRLVVLEGCPDSIHNVLRFRFGSWMGACVEWMLQQLTLYRSDGASALKSVEHFPLHIPIAFVTSLGDTNVPASGTFDMVRRLRERGHRHVHLLVLQDAHHNNYYSASNRDRQAYKAFVHGLLEQYVLLEDMCPSRCVRQMC